MYSIKDYSYDQAEKLGVKIRPSKKSHYKIDILDMNGDYITSIGNKKYLDFPSYLELKGEKFALNRRRLYHLRHKNDNKERGFYALNILW